MLVRCPTRLLVNTLCLALLAAQGRIAAGFQFGVSDWQLGPNVDPIHLATNAETAFRTFKNVHLRTVMDITCLAPADPSGHVRGRMVMDSYFWSINKVQIEYVAYGGVPTSEWFVIDGSGTRYRFGPEVKGDPKSKGRAPIFNVGSEAALVELWPHEFPKLLFSSFGGGNATLSRYVKALKNGTGKYKVSVWKRYVRAGESWHLQHRILATREKVGKSPASTVEIVFDGEAPFLPQSIRATYGTDYELRWSSAWYNNAQMPRDPTLIGEAGKPGSKNPPPLRTKNPPVTKKKG